MIINITSVNNADEAKNYNYENNNGWISVKDRLPDEGKEVLTTNGKGITIDYIRYYGRFEYECITHWMPLPEPPKEIEE